MSRILDGEEERHESYGMINFSRISWGGSGACLFGSSIRHGHLIRMTVSRASLKRDLSRDWYHSREPLVTVDLSLTQFVEAITTMNTSGVPCTLARVGNEGMEPPPYQSKRAQFQDEFMEDCAEVAGKIDDLEAFAANLLQSKSVSKGERETLLGKIRMLRQEIASNMPFVVSQFNEQMDRTVMEAKGEVEAFVQHRLISAGMAAIQGETLLSIEEQPRNDEAGE